MLLIILVAVIIIGAIIANYKKIKAIVSSVEAKAEQVSEQVSETVSPVLQDVEKVIEQAAAIAPKNEAIAKAKIIYRDSVMPLENWEIKNILSTTHSNYCEQEFHLPSLT